MSMKRFREGLLQGMSPLQADYHASLWKKDSDPPDYEPMAEATKYSTDMLMDMADAQLAESTRQFDLMQPTMDRIAKSQADTAEQQAQQGKDHYDFYKENYRPVEEDIIEDANNYNTEGERERIASAASADVAKAESNSRMSNARAMASMGINPNSMKYASVNKKSGLQTAAMKSGAMTGARNRAKDVGYARKLDVAGMGRGLPGLSSAAYNSGVNAGNSSVNSIAAPSNFLMNGYNSAANTLGGAANANMSGNQTILNAQSDYSRVQAQNNASKGSTIGTIVGTAAGYLMYASDRRLKENIEKVGVHKKSGLNLYEFNYKTDKDKRYIGFMADEVKDVFPEAVHKNKDGYLMVNYSKTGFEMRAV